MKLKNLPSLLKVELPSHVRVDGANLPSHVRVDTPQSLPSHVRVLSRILARAVGFLTVSLSAARRAAGGAP